MNLEEYKRRVKIRYYLTIIIAIFLFILIGITISYFI